MKKTLQNLMVLIMISAFTSVILLLALMVLSFINYYDPILYDLLGGGVIILFLISLICLNIMINIYERK